MDITEVKVGDYFGLPKTVVESSNGMRVSERSFWRLRDDGSHEEVIVGYTVEEGTTIIHVVATAPEAHSWVQSVIAGADQRTVVVELGTDPDSKVQEVVNVTSNNELELKTQKPKANVRRKTLGETLKKSPTPAGTQESVKTPPRPRSP
jgi:hypothetical protein